MYTANTMASAAEALGMSLPGSSSFPAESQEKQDECSRIGEAMRVLLEKNILPRDIMTKDAFENAMVRNLLKRVYSRLILSNQVLTMILGGSTNAVCR